jgi:hypothetical protein
MKFISLQFRTVNLKSVHHKYKKSFKPFLNVNLITYFFIIINLNLYICENYLDFRTI